ncbi:putative 2-oxoglutarate and iron-dependent oxygenase domain-containing protein 1 isoform 1 [Apostichopus japonicus]|uniref:Putative 2-oxoglutarate and iron-dependent oxygenase domain-containing protein 1 isoform 1 n=1 Tax=Stichopus japonicus TaxID=307972 RepID=A0A2G8L1G6_STIJA|nr:putative 2-oxoglutarate and iron-dependent oxygenase domain-containing protein 1 isoform 1 [Apostichopus japonicus]
MSLELNTHYGMTIKDQLRDALINKKCYGLVTDSTSNDSGRPVAEANIHTQSENIDAAAVHTDPFTCCVLPNFIQDERFLEGLKDELLALDFHDKSNDLYKFQQSGALQNTSSHHISGLRKFLYEDFRGWLRDVTGIEFNDTVDMTCSKYNYTDILLCHDDELEGRRVAFILYLVPPWTREDGGLLDLFKTDEHFRPTRVSKSLLPKWNTFVFFEVTPKSFHQVSEILNQDKLRLSISGWFHGSSVPRPETYIEPAGTLSGHLQLQEGLFVKWMNPCYIDPDSHSQISSTFNEESQIQLPTFFNEDVSEDLAKALRSPEVRWTRRGPPDRRSYEVARTDSYPLILKECLDVMHSELMFLLLSRLTGLKLHEDVEDSSSDEEDTEEARQDQNGKYVKNSLAMKTRGGNPRCRVEVRRWSHGSYTLIHDTDTVGSEFSLDCNLFLGCGEWNSNCGGFISYIAKGEDEELLSVEPQNNTLALVYKDTDTLSFTKHLNHRFTKLSTDGEENAFFTISLVFYE